MFHLINLIILPQTLKSVTINYKCLSNSSRPCYIEEDCRLEGLDITSKIITIKSSFIDARNCGLLTTNQRWKNFSIFESTIDANYTNLYFQSMIMALSNVIFTYNSTS